MPFWWLYRRLFRRQGLSLHLKWRIFPCTLQSLFSACQPLKYIDIQGSEATLRCYPIVPVVLCSHRCMSLPVDPLLHQT